MAEVTLQTCRSSKSEILMQMEKEHLKTNIGAPKLTHWLSQQNAYLEKKIYQTND